MELINLCDEENLLEMEDYYILSFNTLDRRSGYNAKTAIRQMGQKHSEETKRKIGVAHLGNHYGLGYRHTKEAISKIRDFQINHKKTPEHILNIAIAWEKIQKPVLKLDLNGNLIKKYNSTRDAAIDLGNENKKMGIYQVVLGKHKTAYGFKWRYA
jgi:group I intron endonuclease